MPYILSFETGTQVQQLLRLIDTDAGIKAAIGWRGLPASAHTIKALQQVYEDVPDLLVMLFIRKTSPENLVTKARRALGLLDGGVQRGIQALPRPPTRQFHAN